MLVLNHQPDNVDVTCDIKRDFDFFDSSNLWNVIYERLKNQAALASKNSSCDAARDIENRWKNRYRDISPYDDTRVFLDSLYDGDYINASYVVAQDAPTKKYILTQGPMQQTVSHFWLMVWEQRSPAIIMLNRIFEKGIMRCYPYFPHQDGTTCLNFNDIRLRVRLENECTTQLFTKRVLLLMHMETGERHQLIHMHYTNWPDFGVPKSPSGMLNFLWAVRATGTMSDPKHPAVVHCSAGVGRSGAFVLIDLALHLVESRGTMTGVDLGQLFVELRRCRMGIIQTSDQLRFCYSAVIRGSEALLQTPKEEIPFIKFEPQADEDEHSTGSSDSDDIWNGLEQEECESSSAEEDFDRVEDAEDLVEDVEEGDEEAPVLLQQILKVGVPSSSRPTIDVYNRCDLSSRTNQAWLYESPERSAFSITTSVGVGPGSKEPPSALGAWNERIPCASQDAQVSSLPKFRSPFFRPDAIDRSNNALPDTMVDDEEEVSMPRLNPPVHPQALDSSTPITGESTDPSEINSKPDGDGTANVHETEHRVTEPLETEVHPQDTDLDPLAFEYLQAAYALESRREIRRQRQLRLREQILRTQQLMREANLERKRWIPVHILRHLRRFFTESGIVQSSQGAVISSAAVLLLAMGFALVGYQYCFNTV